jgi:type II secretory pathway pseudopilin PulG
MGTNERTVGFTIIETMLFLAVTGLLAVGILAGTGGAINQQRYRDSVNSLQSLLLDQYSKVVSVVNDRDASWRCDATGTVSQSSGEPRGTGECMLLGRLVSISEDGKQVATADVVGRRLSASADEESNDITELKTNYALQSSPINREVKDVAWGATVVKPGTTTAQPATLLIIRSPLSGGMMTFATQAATDDLKAMIEDGVSSVPFPLCVSPGAGVVAGSQLGIRISAFAAAPSAVQIAPEEEHLCQ